MLRYIELVSKLAPPLWVSPHKWVAHQEAAPEMKIKSFHIDMKREGLHKEIRDKGAAQKAAKEEERRRSRR